MSDEAQVQEAYTGPRGRAFHPTPEPVVEALLHHHRPPNVVRVLVEPSAGDGAIVRVAKREGFEVVAVEYREECRGNLASAGASRVIIGDWLQQTAGDLGLGGLRWGIIGNPPWSPADEMRAHVRHCLEVQEESPGCCWIALLLPNSFPHTALLELHTCAYYPLAPRPQFPGCTNKFDCGWFVWWDGPGWFEPIRWK